MLTRTMSRVTGSSPLARGTPGKPPQINWDIGLIPARAGNTRTRNLRKASLGAHPRSRGEHMGRSQAMIREAGSSPLARGTRTALLLGAVVIGLIPARAGNTNSIRASERQVRAHPRSRGEHRSFSSPVSPTTGSSPLARGTLKTLIIDEVSMGLIPARAGNTDYSFPLRGRERAHPRSRGEHTPLLPSGSSA